MIEGIKIIPIHEIETKVVSTNVKVTSGGANDYGELIGKPMINNVVLASGNNTFSEIGIVNDKNFVFEQKVASPVWNITHNLSKFPSVSVVDSGGSIVIGDINYIDKDSLVITFSAQFTGTAYLN